jgi:hypothetical protein
LSPLQKKTSAVSNLRKIVAAKLQLNKIKKNCRRCYKKKFVAAIKNCGSSSKKKLLLQLGFAGNQIQKKI